VGSKDRPAGQLPGAQGRKGVTGIFGNTLLVNLGFHAQNNFSENYPKFWHVFSRKFASPVPNRKILIKIGLKEHQIISLRREPTCLEPTLTEKDKNK
jgi:hypothetical protein